MRCLRAASLATGCLVALVVTGCTTTYDRVFDENGTAVRLREQKRFLSTVERGFEHPFTISAVRVAHILSRVDIRTDAEGGAQRYPAIPLETLYRISDGVAKAFAKANPNQELVVQSIRREKRFGVFNRNFLTSFIVYRKDGLIFIHVDRSDWEVPPRKKDNLPQPQIGKHPLTFRVLPGRAMRNFDSQSVAVEWRDPVFDKPTRTRVGKDGKVVRRTILMESSDDEDPLAAEEQGPSPLPGNLSSAQLRALAELEDRRRRGEVSETEYLSERRDILEGTSRSKSP